MYDVNLIRKRIVPERQKKVIFSVVSFSVLVYVLTFLGVACFSFVNFRMIDVYASEIDGLQDNLAALYPGTPTRDELSTMLSRVRPDLREIEGLLDKRPAVSVLWEGIVRCLPEGVWLESVRVTTAAQQSDGAKKRGKGEAKAGGIVIRGYAVASQAGRGSTMISEFTMQLEADPAFKDRLTNVKSAEKGIERAGGSSVVGFEVTGDFKR
ncbi:MAG: PilN domain-containing protein [Candidatus Eisenbacteria bacterium]|nr:PilN domain-containing protein [Candidatus Eisenbacteria bacterium]